MAHIPFCLLRRNGKGAVRRYQILAPAEKRSTAAALFLYRATRRRLIEKAKLRAVSRAAGAHRDL